MLELGREEGAGSVLGDVAAELTRFRITPERSAVVVNARSNVGPIAFGTTKFSGEIAVGVRQGVLADVQQAIAHLEIPVASLASGNALYDAEIHRRMGALRYPTIYVQLTSATTIPDTNRFLVGGTVALRDVVQEMTGAVSVDLTGPNTLLVTGEQALDIRDFRIEVPSTLLLKIYPEITIEMHLEAQSDETGTVEVSGT